MSEIEMIEQVMQCPATMCPLIAPNGSPWTGEKNSVCPEQDDLDSGGCAWLGMGGCNQGMLCMVDEALNMGGRSFVVGPNKPKRHGIGASKSYDCPNANFCSWQKQSPTGLCGPRQALKEGLDPRVCLF